MRVVQDWQRLKAKRLAAREQPGTREP
jgi:hypothetical protein